MYGGVYGGTPGTVVVSVAGGTVVVSVAGTVVVGLGEGNSPTPAPPAQARCVDTGIAPPPMLTEPEFRYSGRSLVSVERPKRTGIRPTSDERGRSSTTSSDGLHSVIVHWSGENDPWIGTPPVLAVPHSISGEPHAIA